MGKACERRERRERMRDPNAHAKRKAWGGRKGIGSKGEGGNEKSSFKKKAEVYADFMALLVFYKIQH